MRLVLLVCLIAACLLAQSPLTAGDWPQILGPNRDGIATGEHIADSISANPKPVWSRPVGDGFAGVAVVGESVYLFHRIGDVERVEAINAGTGKPLWSSDAPTNYGGAIVSDSGPRCVPTVVENRILVFGAEGQLRCLDAPTGKELWAQATGTMFDVPESYFGAGSAPVVDGDRVIVNVGGARKNAGVVAFALETGAVQWTATTDQASYSAPIVRTVGESRQAIILTRLNCVGLNPTTGKQLWNVPFGARGPTVNAAVPVLLNDRLLLTASYGVGAGYFQLSATDAREVWRDRDLLASQYTTPILHDGLLYGIDGRQDGAPASLVCVDPAARKRLWSKTGFGYATLILAGETLLAQTTDGDLVALKVDKNDGQELARLPLTQSTARALPALSNGRYFVRDETTLYCYDLGRGDAR